MSSSLWQAIKKYTIYLFDLVLTLHVRSYSPYGKNSFKNMHEKQHTLISTISLWKKITRLQLARAKNGKKAR